jgi:D-3-phosphoglycerate dehydrogenase
VPVRILITDNDLGDSQLEIDLLRKALGAEVTVADCSDEDDVVAAVRDVNPDAVIVQWAPVTQEVFEVAPNLKAISRLGIGIDMIDTAAAAEHDVAVMNVPHYCIEEVATHAVALGLALWRRIPQFDAGLREGRWDAATNASRVHRLSESTVGLLGMGRIGALVAASFAGWGARIIVCDPVEGDDGYERVSLERLAGEADLISLHAPLVPETHQIIGPAFLRSCARSPILVNTSRGPLIDEAALVYALTSGTISGAGLDVFEDEPLHPANPLRSAPNTLLTPHAAWCSDLALPELRRQAALNLVRHFGAA